MKLDIKNKVAAVIVTTSLVVGMSAGMGYYYKNVSGYETANTTTTAIATTAGETKTTWQTPGVEYKFADNTPGNAYGKISLTISEAGTYNFYWGDDKGQKLKYNGVEFTELGIVKTTSENLNVTYEIPSPYTAIPEGAKQLLVCDKDSKTVYSEKIPEKKQFNEGKLSYKFALMSDVHYNRYKDFTSDDSVPAFDNALKFINSQGIDFVGLTGDLSKSGEESAYTKFKTATDKYPNMTVYTCMGNHDVGGRENFKKYVNTKKDTDSNVKFINDTGVDFAYEKGGDVFVFLSQLRWSYGGKNSTLLDDEQLNWLEKTLNNYADKNVYLFFHTYFASENGDVTTAVGNLKNPGGYTYDLTYTFGAKDETRFRTILNKYPNVTMFSGHSHWAYDQQKYNPNTNIGNINSKKTGASLVHIASVSAPRTIEANSTKRDENAGVRSEGMIALKYRNSTVYMGTDFKNGRYMAYATYINKDGAKQTPVAAIKTGSSKITSVGKVKKVSKKSKKYKVLIKYKKVEKAVKYQIQYSTSKRFKAKYTKTRTTDKTKYTLTKLKNKKTYYVRVRAFRYQFGYRVYGDWSKTKKIKIKVKTKTKKKAKKK